MNGLPSMDERLRDSSQMHDCKLQVKHQLYQQQAKVSETNVPISPMISSLRTSTVLPWTGCPFTIVATIKQKQATRGHKEHTFDHCIPWDNATICRGRTTWIHTSHNNMRVFLLKANPNCTNFL